MAESDGRGPDAKQFSGKLSLPGDKDTHRVSVAVDTEREEVSIHFDSPLGGSSDWKGLDVQMARRLKLHEVVFMTSGLPQAGLKLTWKMNVTLDDETLAGVVIARPGETGIKGENGYILEGPGRAGKGRDNYLTRLSSESYRP